MTLGDMAFGWMFGIGRVVKVGWAEAGVIPGIDLFEAPDFEGVCVAVTDRNGADGVLDFSHGAAGVLPIIDERAVGVNPLGLGAGVSAALGVAEVIFNERIWSSDRTAIGPSAMWPCAWAT